MYSWPFPDFNENPSFIGQNKTSMTAKAKEKGLTHTCSHTRLYKHILLSILLFYTMWKQQDVDTNGFFMYFSWHYGHI